MLLNSLERDQERILPLFFPEDDVSNHKGGWLEGGNYQAVVV